MHRKDASGERSNISFYSALAVNHCTSSGTTDYHMQIFGSFSGTAPDDLSGKFYFPVVLAAIGIAISLFSFPFLSEMPSYLDQARSLADGNLIDPGLGYSTPIGYPGLLSAFYSMGGVSGIIVFQSLVHLGITCFCWRILRKCGVSSALIGIGTLIISLHPHILLNIKRINEGALASLVILLILDNLIRAPRSNTGSIILGIYHSILILLRPNAITLIPLAVYCIHSVSRNMKSSLRNLTLTIITGATFYLGFSKFVTSSFLFWPKNGPYNFFAGNNQFTASSLLENQNAEQSIKPALENAGYLPESAYDISGSEYNELAISFITSEPIEFIRLIFLKCYVFFSPRLANADNFIEFFLQAALASFPVIWLCLIAFYSRRKYTNLDKALIVLVLLYTAPFLITNADPRMRLPLDVVFILHSLILLDRNFPYKINPA